jgi:L-malate glycosyltransferase
MQPVRKQILICWEQFGPYHFDRLVAATEALRASFDVVGIEIASGTTTNLWRDIQRPPHVALETLYPGTSVEHLSGWQRARRLLRRILRPHVAAVFFVGYHNIDSILGALVCRLAGRRAILMTESKFDDYPRYMASELLKRLLVAPFHAALVAGQRNREYVEFLGLRRKPIAYGYDTVSRDRMRASAGGEFAPGGVPFGQRSFLAVARFIPKKNLPFLITAHARYVELAGAGARPLVIVGEGVDRPAIETAKSAHRRPELVELTGALESPAVAKQMAVSLALCIPSIEEQWGLVVNEAVFLGLPILASPRCGSVDTLVRNGLNGFVLEPDDLEAWATGMLRLSSDEAFWARAARYSADLSERGDASNFGAGAASLLRALRLLDPASASAQSAVHTGAGQ